MHHVAVEEDRGQGRSHGTPVAKSSSSVATVLAMPARLAFKAFGPLAGKSRATVRPCFVISTSSPPSTSSSRARILAFTSVAVSLLDMGSLYWSVSLASAAEAGGPRRLVR